MYLIRKILFLLLFLGAAFSSFAAPLLSKKSTVSLLTIFPDDDDLFSAWGHSTFWIYDPIQQVDKVYSFGTYDFEQPNFYLNFVKGHLNYRLSTSTMEEQYLSAEVEQRKIVKQELDLDSSQKQKLFDYLEWNLLPQNRNYFYDFYLDNCSSRLRDILKTCLGDHLQFDSKVESAYSFRQWMNIFLTEHPWSALGMNIGLGAPADKLTDYSTQMYIPFNLRLAFSEATLDSHPLVKSEVDILPIPDKTSSGTNYTIPLFFVLVLLFSLLFTFFATPNSFATIAFDGILFGFPFILGTVLALLWIATDHWVCAWNTDLLWANPFCFMYFFLFSKKKLSNPVRYVCVFLISLGGLYMTVAYLFPEKPILILFPLILALQIRASHRLITSQKPKPTL